MSLLVLLQFVCLIGFALLLVVAAWQDLRTMRIADAVSLAIVAVFGVWVLSGLSAGDTTLIRIGVATGCAVAVFALGTLGFAVGALGGGDVKLLAASSLFAGPALLPDFLMVTALAGGVLGLASFMGARVGPAASVGDASVAGRMRGSLAYGPAIAAGGLWVAVSLATS
ncbi:MAG: pilus assembly protein CpaA [Reyranella sp.]|uniref:A24 family peptidase n=1 Tax=Reyranella sp. TaxID=1929291 RepID=UPI00122C0F4D|nr:prepilin peptidase [Reyranella sp.]TAJ39787.1 MAG: pilus assembly protein CpaA [Reyranella sp.]